MNALAFHTHARRPDEDGWIAKLLGVQRIEDDQLPMLAALLRNYYWTDPYCGSAAYCGLTGRHGLWIAVRQGTFAILCRHPNQPERFLIFPAVGDNGETLTAELSATLSSARHAHQLARVPAERAVSLAKAVQAPVPFDEEALDWRYPVHVLDPAAVAGHAGQRFKDFRKNVHRMDREHVETVPLDPSAHRDAIHDIAHAWTAAKGVTDGSAILDVIEPYERVLDLSTRLPIHGRLYLVDGEPAGFVAWEETDSARGLANGLADLTRGDVRGLSAFMSADVCRELADRGFTNYCIGGSEGAGLDSFKRKMQPVRSIVLQSIQVAAGVAYPSPGAMQARQVQPKPDFRPAA